MLEYIEIWNFESHKHTIIDDLSDGLNLMCGESNSGKTSIVRALKLAAYNVFDPGSVRVGTKTCKVFVRSHRGTVLVERGKNVNKWEVTPKGGDKEEFDKVGVAIVPRAAEIMGLRMVKLGDVDVPVNIMDQLESHFMLSSVGGDKASGSMRAQIVDEISGLSGIEGVIKDVSLDRHRFGRDVKRTEDEMNETISKLHDDDKIRADEKVLLEAETLVNESDEAMVLVGELKILHSECCAESDSVKALEKRLVEMPDAQRAVREIDKAEALMSRAVSAEKLYEESKKVSDEVQLLETKKAELEGIGDPSVYIKVCEDALEKVDKAASLYKEAMEVREEVCAREKWLVGIGDPSKSLKKALEAAEEAQRASGMLSDLEDTARTVKSLEDKLKALDKQANVVDKELKEVLSEVKVCPLTLGPILDECIKQAGEAK